MTADELDGRMGEAWSGERPNGSHINVVIAKRGSPTAQCSTRQKTTVTNRSLASTKIPTSGKPRVTEIVAGTFQDITSGNNRGHQAGPGWDACTGWGSPNGTKLVQALSG